MKRFTALILAIDQTTRTNDKIAALASYLRDAPESDKLWALYLFSGKRPKRMVNTSLVRQWAANLVGYPLWLFEESYHVVGDLAETLALLLGDGFGGTERSLTEWMEILSMFASLGDEEKKARLYGAWNELSRDEKFVFNKLITGGFRVGVSRNIVVRALAQAIEVEPTVVAHKLMGDWTPGATSFAELFDDDPQGETPSRPYPFFLASPLEQVPSTLGDRANWQVEWKWDGIRGQLIKRAGGIYLWSRGEELITDKFPELSRLAAGIPDGTVIDGEIIGMRDGAILPFADLQTRIGRKNITSKALQAAPAGMLAYDLLEHEGADIRERPLRERRSLLEEVVGRIAQPTLLLSPVLDASSWEKLREIRQTSRSESAEGLMIKGLNSPYQVGRRRGDWWKWKIEPYSIDAVLIYAQRGHGKRANLFTDYTLAVWDEGGVLVPFAKAYSGLTDKEILEVDAFVKQNTIDKFGPVRTVKPELVFEIGFEGIQTSSRHKSGIAVRFPRILRWRRDKLKEEADTVVTLRAILGTPP